MVNSSFGRAPQWGQGTRLAIGSSDLVKVGLGAEAPFVERITSLEAVETHFGRGRMRVPACQEMREAVAGGGRRLEAAVTPAGIEIEIIDMGAVDDRRAVHR